MGERRRGALEDGLGEATVELEDDAVMAGVSGDPHIGDVGDGNGRVYVDGRSQLNSTRSPTEPPRSLR